MTQNIYDNEGFFAQYSRLTRSVEGLDGAPEWPTLRGMLPELSGCRAVDLGCGFGWFCRWARRNGAASVLGLDVSAKMLDRARAEGRVSHAGAEREKWGPGPEQVAAHPEWADDAQCPPFLLVAARKN